MFISNPSKSSDSKVATKLSSLGISAMVELEKLSNNTFIIFFIMTDYEYTKAVQIYCIVICNVYGHALESTCYILLESL